MKEKTLVIKPTFTCNFHCWYCKERRALHKFLNKKKLMSLKDWKTAFEITKEHDFNNITISGAEPTLYQNFNEIVNIIKQYFNSITLMTNGSTLSNIDTSCYKYVQISFADIDFDSFHENRVAQKSKFEKQFENIVNFLKKKGKTLAINCIPLTTNRLLKLDKILYLSEIFGFDDVNLQPLEGNLKTKLINLSPNKDDINYFEEHIFPRIQPKFLERVKKVIPILRAASNGAYRGDTCSIIESQLILLATGDIHACNIIEYSHEPHGVVGNILKNSWEMIMYNLNNFKKERSKFCYRCPMQLH